MRYAHHNLFQNLKRIKNSKDMTISRELIVSEIGKVIVGRPFEVIRILRGCGISVGGSSRRELVYAVNFNLARNSCLRNKISALIAANQLPFDTTPTRNINRQGNVGEFDTDQELDSYVNVVPQIDATKTTTSSGGMTAGDWTSGISTLVGIGYGIWQTSASRKDAKEQRAHEQNLANMNSDLMLKQMDLDSQTPAPIVAGAGGSGTSMFTWVLVGVGVLAIGAFALISSRKNRGVVVAAPALPAAPAVAPVQ